MTNNNTTDNAPELAEGRWDTIRHEVGEYLMAGRPESNDFDEDGIVNAVGATANSIGDLTDDEWDAILEANDGA